MSTLISNKFPRAVNIKITEKFLDERGSESKKRGYPEQRWVQFCRILLIEGFELRLYEAKETVSKYITIVKGEKQFVVRFSNHRPNKTRESRGDCDFFVGVNNGSVTNTNMALVAVKNWAYGETPF